MQKEADGAFTCASQHVTHADDQEDPGGGRGPRQRVLSQPPVSFPLGQELQNGKQKAENGAAQSQRPEQHRLEGDHEVRRRVSVRAAEGLQPGGSHGAPEETGERGQEGEVGYGVRRQTQERKRSAT